MQRYPTSYSRNTNSKNDFKAYPYQSADNNFTYAYKNSQRQPNNAINAYNPQPTSLDSYSLYPELLIDAKDRKANMRDPEYTESRRNDYLENHHGESYPSGGDFLQMEAESVGGRHVQSKADKAMSAEELMRLLKKPVQADQFEIKQAPTQNKQAPVQRKEAYVSIKPAESTEAMGLSRDVVAARKKLADFDLNTLVITKKGIFDMRYNTSKEFLAQCSAAEVDPIDYFYENVEKDKEEETVVSNKSEVKYDREVKKGKETVVTKGSREEEIKRKMAEAKRKLDEIVESRGLVRTKNGDLDRRYKANKDYLELEAQTKASYYQ